MEKANSDAEEITLHRHAVVEGPATANALDSLTSQAREEAQDQWRRMWDVNAAESAKRLQALHTAQDMLDDASDHAVCMIAYSC